MADPQGPWVKYQQPASKEAGPWSKYAQPAASPDDTLQRQDTAIEKMQTEAQPSGLARFGKTLLGDFMPLEGERKEATGGLYTDPTKTLRRAFDEPVQAYANQLT